MSLSAVSWMCLDSPSGLFFCFFCDRFPSFSVGICMLVCVLALFVFLIPATPSMVCLPSIRAKSSLRDG